MSGRAIQSFLVLDVITIKIKFENMRQILRTFAKYCPPDSSLSQGAWTAIAVASFFLSVILLVAITRLTRRMLMRETIRKSSRVTQRRSQAENFEMM